MSPRNLSMPCLCLMLAACASLQPESGGPTIAGDGTCHAEPVQAFVGKPATQDVMREVWRGSGSGLIRPIAPGQAVTRDYRRDRVNVHVDADNAITGIDCG
jgi:hypothetical protein